MCTALSLSAHDHFFGRNLDHDTSYGEEVCVMPRAYPLPLRHMEGVRGHAALVGMATVVDGVPLYYDAVNEHGIAIAGLHFLGNACYAQPTAGCDNVTSYELIPWLLGQCRTVGEARERLSHLWITDDDLHADLPSAPLHWMLSDAREDIVIEATRDGIQLYDNPVGVLTNNPPFPHQLDNLRRYRHLRNDNALVEREVGLGYETYSQGLGAVGLPGDVSSMSRFVRAAFLREHSVCGEDERQAVGQFFHILSSVEMVRGACRTDAGTWDMTLYSACMNTTRGRYYYTTYENRRITCVDMHLTELDGDCLHRYPLSEKQEIQYQR